MLASTYGEQCFDELACVSMGLLMERTSTEQVFSEEGFSVTRDLVNRDLVSRGVVNWDSGEQGFR